jgi:2-dehydro-3-deoxyphosphogluconate aldolase/(4S)-4-hydroxy-2-oxoglutarate aldolase
VSRAADARGRGGDGPAGAPVRSGRSGSGAPGREAVLKQLAAQRVIPVLRTADVDDAVATARACAAAGMRAIELTRTTPDVERALEALRGDGLLLGLGTVTHRDQVAAAARAGARFVVSFCAPAGMVAEAHAHGLAAIPGAFTPGEIAACAAHGADAVKVFPARMASPAYLKDLRAVLPGVRLMATGGLRAAPDSAGAWLDAGALAVGIGSELGSAARDGAEEVERRAHAALDGLGRAAADERRTAGAERRPAR